ncbi:hypothetical protein NDU88_005915 [Pleurodeles waltl]|uniref:Uncharacterized protein n=1 Tax=Pleurodeles waltl TaxID=8319 RepID=A0AAV7RQH0_PLEWA|nr:hypothetical protein NDU88_005915 [Pleurodeles waltl]
MRAERSRPHSATAEQQKTNNKSTNGPYLSSQWSREAGKTINRRACGVGNKYSPAPHCVITYTWGPGNKNKERTMKKKEKKKKDKGIAGA